MNLVVCLILNLDPDGEQGHDARFFKSHGLTVTDEPMPNGLHYKPNNWFGTDQIDPFKKRTTEPDIRAILSRMRRGMKGQRLTLIGRIDMYNEKSHTFDLRKIGFHFPAHLPDHNPFDLTEFRAKTTHRGTRILRTTQPRAVLPSGIVICLRGTSGRLSAPPCTRSSRPGPSEMFPNAPAKATSICAPF
jgi:hypothetical protein